MNASETPQTPIIGYVRGVLFLLLFSSLTVTGIIVKLAATIAAVNSLCETTKENQLLCSKHDNGNPQHILQSLQETGI
jgi:hypothetical protein